jgi:hypothetical protein
MAELKLRKLPDRTPMKIVLTVTPDLHQSLVDYAAVYAATYGREEPISELIPAMLESFLDSDREFSKVHRRTTGKS